MIVHNAPSAINTDCSRNQQTALCK